MRMLAIAICCLGLSDTPAIAQTRDNPLRVGGDVRAPRKTKDAVPAYPEAARAKGIRGSVILELIVDPEGRVAEVMVLRPLELVTAAAVRATWQWAYVPTEFRGKPAWVMLTVSVSFPPRSRLPPEPRDRGEGRQVDAVTKVRH
jgi:TonB family protein